jgi:hypothetical protein
MRRPLPLPDERQESSFLKKRSKKLLPMRPAIRSNGGTGGRRNGQKFFASFFQKRTFFHVDWYSSAAALLPQIGQSAAARHRKSPVNRRWCRARS